MHSTSQPVCLSPGSEKSRQLVFPSALLCLTFSSILGSSPITASHIWIRLPLSPWPGHHFPPSANRCFCPSCITHGRTRGRQAGTGWVGGQVGCSVSSNPLPTVHDHFTPFLFPPEPCLPVHPSDESGRLLKSKSKVPTSASIPALKKRSLSFHLRLLPPPLLWGPSSFNFYAFWPSSILLSLNGIFSVDFYLNNNSFWELEFTDCTIHLCECTVQWFLVFSELFNQPYF